MGWLDAPVAEIFPNGGYSGTSNSSLMVCGQGMKTLKRHLGTSHGMKPGEYRKQFGIPTGTALAAKNYSESRRALAIDQKLGEGLAKARATRMASRVATESAQVKTKKGKRAKAAPVAAVVETPAKAMKKGAKK